MEVHKFTEYQEKYIKDNYLKISIIKMANKLSVTIGVLKGFYKRQNLIVPKEIKEKLRVEAFKKTISQNNGNIELQHPFYKHNWHPITGKKNEY